MRRNISLNTAIQLSSIGYQPDDFHQNSCEYYAVDKILIRSDYGDYNLPSGGLFTLDADEHVAQGKYVYAPCFSEVQQGMYENHKLFIEIHLGLDGEFFWNVQTEYGSGNEKYYSEIFNSGDEYFKDISDAYEDAILKCIEYIKNK